MKNGIGNCCPEIKNLFLNIKGVKHRVQRFFQKKYSPAADRRKGKKTGSRQTLCFLSHVPVFFYQFIPLKCSRS